MDAFLWGIGLVGALLNVAAVFVLGGYDESPGNWVGGIGLGLMIAGVVGSAIRQHRA